MLTDLSLLVICHCELVRGRTLMFPTVLSLSLSLFLRLAVIPFHSLSKTAAQQLEVPDCLPIFLIGDRITSESFQVLEICGEIKLFRCLLKRHAV